jgi:hypothetical protein
MRGTRLSAGPPASRLAGPAQRIRSTPGLFSPLPTGGHGAPYSPPVATSQRACTLGLRAFRQQGSPAPALRHPRPQTKTQTAPRQRPVRRPRSDPMAASPPAALLDAARQLAAAGRLEAAYRVHAAATAAAPPTAPSEAHHALLRERLSLLGALAAPQPAAGAGGGAPAHAVASAAGAGAPAPAPAAPLQEHLARYAARYWRDGALPAPGRRVLSVSDLHVDKAGAPHMEWVRAVSPTAFLGDVLVVAGGGEGGRAMAIHRARGAGHRAAAPYAVRQWDESGARGRVMGGLFTHCPSRNEPTCPASLTLLPAKAAGRGGAFSTHHLRATTRAPGRGGRGRR